MANKKLLTDLINARIRELVKGGFLVLHTNIDSLMDEFRDMETNHGDLEEQLKARDKEIKKLNINIEILTATIRANNEFIRSATDTVLDLSESTLKKVEDE